MVLVLIVSNTTTYLIKGTKEVQTNLVFWLKIGKKEKGCLAIKMDIFLLHPINKKHVEGRKETHELFCSS
jgi:hypothetical protein